MHVDWRRIGDLRVALHQDADLALFAHGLLCGGDRARPADARSAAPCPETTRCCGPARMISASGGNGGIAGASVDLARPSVRLSHDALHLVQRDQQAAVDSRSGERRCIVPPEDARAARTDLAATPAGE